LAAEPVWRGLDADPNAMHVPHQETSDAETLLGPPVDDLCSFGSVFSGVSSPETGWCLQEQENGTEWGTLDARAARLRHALLTRPTTTSTLVMPEHVQDLPEACRLLVMPCAALAEPIRRPYTSAMGRPIAIINEHISWLVATDARIGVQSRAELSSEFPALGRGLLLGGNAIKGEKFRGNAKNGPPAWALRRVAMLAEQEAYMRNILKSSASKESVKRLKMLLGNEWEAYVSMLGAQQPDGRAGNADGHPSKPQQLIAPVATSERPDVDGRAVCGSGVADARGLPLGAPQLSVRSSPDQEAAVSSLRRLSVPVAAKATDRTWGAFNVAWPQSPSEVRDKFAAGGLSPPLCSSAAASRVGHALVARGSLETAPHVPQAAVQDEAGLHSRVCDSSTAQPSTSREQSNVHEQRMMPAAAPLALSHHTGKVEGLIENGRKAAWAGRSAMRVETKSDALAERSVMVVLRSALLHPSAAPSLW
jgi:hypothetical protein